MKTSPEANQQKLELIGYVIKHQEYHGIYQNKEHANGMEFSFHCQKCANDQGN